ncbi:hypothetical protein [Paenibacillus sp. MMO-58]|uniref:hypothetical protein n=1 Tax=Paenibacillus sp. MMO-58 TaxID=3081290 RepID=UPI003018A5C6
MWKRLRYLKQPLNNEKGITDLIILLIVLPTFLACTFMVILYASYLNRQSKIDDIKDRALQMMQTEGYLSQAIITDTETKLTQLGYPIVNKNGKTYPSFEGSTMTKVLKDDVDPTVKLVIQYPATDLNRVMAFLHVVPEEEKGYFYLEGEGRSEKYE